MVKDDRGSARSDRGPPRPRRGPLRSRQGQGAHRRIPGGAEAAAVAGRAVSRADAGGAAGRTVHGNVRGSRRRGARDAAAGEGRAHARTDSLLRRAAGCRQDLARPVDRQGHEPEVRTHVARRRQGRSRDPRPPPHLHRLDAWPARSGAEVGGLGEPRADARRDRQDHGRHSGRSRGGAARGARPRPEPRLPRSLHGDPDRSLARAVHRDRQPARHHSSGAARSDGAHLAERLYGGGEGPHRAALPRAATARGERTHSIAAPHHRRRAPACDHGVHAGSGRANARAADRDDRAEGGGPRRVRAGSHGNGRRPGSGNLPRAAEVPLGSRVPHVASRRRHRGGMDRSRWATCSSSRPR